MRPTFAFAALLCNAFPGSAFAREPSPDQREQMLIWDGSASREQAEKMLTRYQLEFAALREALGVEVSASFPQVIESSTIPGLKPGFFVLSIGVCPPGEAKRALAVLKLIRPQVYARPVARKWDTHMGVCEAFLHWPDSAVPGSDAKWASFLFTRDERAPGPLSEEENHVTGFRLLSLLRNDKGEVVAFNVTKSSSNSSALAPPMIDEGKLEFEETNVEEPCTGYGNQKTREVLKKPTLESRTGVTFEPVTSTQKDQREIQCEPDMG